MKSIEGISEKKLSLLYALWIGISYVLLDPGGYHPSYLASTNVFLFKVIVGYSFVTVLFFCAVVCRAFSGNSWLQTTFSLVVICLVLVATYELQHLYPGLFKWKYWGREEWYSMCDPGVAVCINPDLTRFRYGLLFTHLPCAIVAVALYVWLSGKEKSVKRSENFSPVVETGILLLICSLFSFCIITFGIPLFYMFICMIRRRYRLPRFGNVLSYMIYVYIVFVFILLIVFSGPLSEEMSIRVCGPICVWYSLLQHLSYAYCGAIFCGAIFYGIVSLLFRYRVIGKVKYAFMWGFSVGMLVMSSFFCLLILF